MKGRETLIAHYGAKNPLKGNAYSRIQAVYCRELEEMAQARQKVTTAPTAVP